MSSPKSSVYPFQLRFPLLKIWVNIHHGVCHKQWFGIILRNTLPSFLFDNVNDTILKKFLVEKVGIERSEPIYQYLTFQPEFFQKCAILILEEDIFSVRKGNQRRPRRSKY